MTPATISSGITPSTRRTARRRFGERVAARQQARSEQPVAEQQPGAAGDEDRGQLERAVRRDEAPQRQAQPGAVARRAMTPISTPLKTIM